MSAIDLQHLEVVTGRDLELVMERGTTEVRIHEDALVTATARDVIHRAGLAVTRVRQARSATGSAEHAAGHRARVASGPSRPAGAGARGAQAAFRSAGAAAIKEEIVRVGRKLWDRQYVDGNGGNISCRLGGGLVICTPTLMSKADLTVDDMCLVDLEGNQLAGDRKRSSEIFLHLEIYKVVPEATAVVHCHPPHATAYAVAGVVPPTCMISEHEVFVGPVALVPYETPGTMECARAVVPYVKQHNVILLANHGLVCWADSVTHAEWYAEVMDTTCRILILALSLGVPPAQIPTGKVGDLLAIKRRLGMPDARLSGQVCETCDVPLRPGGIIAAPPGAGAQSCRTTAGAPGPSGDAPDPLTLPDREALVQAVTREVLKALGQKP